MPTISVVMGVYNCKSYKMLKDSVMSIIQQSYNDWEFIICNDGSTDDTLEKLKKVSLLDPRIKVLSYTQNKGLSFALNTCIENSDGKYIARQDDDDISYSDRFERQLRFLEEHTEYAIVGSNADVFDDTGNWGEYTVVERPTKKDFLWNSPFAHPTVIMNKEALLDSGCYRVSKETMRGQDYDLFMRMYSKGYKGYNIQDKLYKYRITSGTVKKKTMAIRINEAKIRYQGFKSLGILGRGFPYVIKPLIIGAIPNPIMNHITRGQYR